MRALRPVPLPAAAIVAVVAALGLSACGSDAPERASGTVTVRSCGAPVSFASVPKRAVVRDTTMVEMLLSLGLRDRLAGYSDFRTKPKVRTPLPRFRKDFAALRFIGGGPLTTETLVSARPDLLFAGYNYGLNPATGVTPERLAARGIPTYVLSETCRVVRPSLPATTLETVWGDVGNLGRIFRVEDRATRLVAGWRSRVEAVGAKLRDATPRPVFAYMSGTDAPFTGSALSVFSDIVRRAGGRNVADGIRKTWAPVSWETVVRSRPELIVIGDYGDEVTPQRKIAYLKSKRSLRDVPAIRNDRFLVLPSEAVNPGVRNPWAVESIAHALHPERVGAPGPVVDDQAVGEGATR